MLRQSHRSFLAILLLAAAVLISACAAGSAEPAAPKIHYGEDICSECGMIINDPRFAAAYAANEGEGAYQTFIFDDIGDMLHHIQKNLTLAGAGWWVHDYQSEEWIDATTAWFVVSDAIKSPMGHGLAAFATEDAAAQFAAEVNGQVFDWDKVRVQHALAGHHH
jgi:copper chaperone NosL